MTPDIYKLSFASASIGIFIVNLDGMILEANEELHRIFGYDMGDMIGLQMDSLVPVAKRDRHKGLRQDFFAAPARRSMGNSNAFEALRKDGAVIHVEVGFASATFEGEDVVVASVLDATERVRLNRSLEAHKADLETQIAARTASYLSAKEEADRNARAKADFLSNMSHDIRTPLNAITGLAYLLGQTDLNNEQKRYLRQLDMASNLLKDIVNDILDFSKLDAGKVALNLEHVSLNALLDSVASIARPAFAHKSVEFIILPDPGVELILTDQLQLTRLLMNLVSNAAKFTDEGSVILSVRIMSGFRKEKILRFAVQDTGTGIAPEDLERIFAPFEQAKISLHRGIEGSGLGLAICSKLLGLMGSELRADSEPGKGSRFWFDIEVQTAMDSPPEPDVTEPRRLLIVGENPEVLDAVARSAEILKWTPIKARSGKAALRMIGQGDDPSGMRPDMILLSGALTTPDAAETAERLAEMLGSPRPLIGMMIKPDQQKLAERLKARNLIDTDIVKPILPATLLRFAQRMPRSGQSQPSGQSGLAKAQTVARSLVGVRILLVDDNEVNRLVASTILQKAGAEVVNLGSGAEALNALANPGPHRFDIVLLDLQMPDMDGYETCRRLRSDRDMTDLPVLAFTAGVLDEQKKAALDAGMNGFISKPFNIDTAVELIWSLTRGATEMAKPQLSSGRDGPYPGISIKRGLEIAEDEAFYRKLLRMFLDYHGDSVDRVNTSETEALMEVCRQLEGVCLNLGFVELYARIRDVMLHIDHKDKRSDAITGFVEAFETVISSVETYLQDQEQVSSDRALADPPVSR